MFRIIIVILLVVILIKIPSIVKTFCCKSTGIDKYALSTIISPKNEKIAPFCDFIHKYIGKLDDAYTIYRNPYKK